MAELILAILLVFFVHEGGHWMAARLLGKRLKFRFAWGRFCVPRFTWTMPYLPKSKQRTVALAGFVTEFLVAGALLASFPHGFGRWVAGVALAHLVSYRFYAGESESDFKWL